MISSYFHLYKCSSNHHAIKNSFRQHPPVERPVLGITKIKRMERQQQETEVRRTDPRVQRMHFPTNPNEDVSNGVSEMMWDVKILFFLSLADHTANRMLSLCSSDTQHGSNKANIGKWSATLSFHVLSYLVVKGFRYLETMVFHRFVQPAYHWLHVCLQLWCQFGSKRNSRHPVSRICVEAKDSGLQVISGKQNVISTLNLHHTVHENQPRVCSSCGQNSVSYFSQLSKCRNTFRSEVVLWHLAVSPNHLRIWVRKPAPSKPAGNHTGVCGCELRDEILCLCLCRMFTRTHTVAVLQ